MLCICRYLKLELLTVRRLLLLGEVPDNVRALLVDLAEDVEEERDDVEVERLVVEEQLGQEAQVLAIQLVVLPIHLRNPVSESTLQFSISHC